MSLIRCNICKCLNKNGLCKSCKCLMTFFLILCKISPCLLHKKCPTQYSTVFNSNIKPEWKSKIDNEVVLSTPSCFNSKGELITRTCVNGSWLPSTPPLCQFSENFDSCPPGFQTLNNLCVIVTAPRNWQTGNYYDHFFENNTKSISGYSREKKFWLPVRRKIKYGPLEHIEHGHCYGDVFQFNISNFEEFFAKDCLIYNVEEKKVQLEDCTKPHPFIQHVPKSVSLYSCPRNCHPAGSKTNKCYCKQKYFCHQLARLESLSDKEIFEKLAGNEICQIENFYMNGSVLHSGNVNTDCLICQRRPVDEETTKMLLSFEEKNRKLFLLVYSPDTIKQDDDDKDIYCFTNAANNALKKKVKIENIFNYEDQEGETLNVFQVKTENYMGEYWCDAFSTKMSIITSNTVIAYSKKKGNEYSLRILVHHVCKIFSCQYQKSLSRIIKKIKNVAFKNFDLEIRLMEIVKFDYQTDSLDLILHLSTKENIEIVEEYKLCLSKLNKLKNETSIEVVHFESSEYCLPDTTNENYTTLNWPLTKIGNVVVSEELCLMENGIPSTRICEGNFLNGTRWSPVIGSCSKNVSISPFTEDLRNVLKAQEIDKIDDIFAILTRSKINLTILDIYYLTRILNRVHEVDRTNMYALDFLDRLMATDQSLLERSQEVLNLTDVTLELTDYILSDFLFNSDSVFIIRKHNLIVHMTNPFLSNMSGLLLYGEDGANLDSLSLLSFQRNETFEDVNTDSLQLAAYVPEEILEQIFNETEQNVSNVLVIITVFLNDSLFIDDNFHSLKYVISVTIPGYGAYLESPIKILFKSEEKNKSKSCGFWDNGKRTSLKKGQWSLLGSNYVESGRDDLHLCSYIHLTHFALLVMSDKKNIVDEDVEVVIVDENFTDHDFVLEIITLIGGIFSFVGLMGIFSTAIFFKSWRQKIGTKILLNLSVAILLETICIHLSEINPLKRTETACKIIGVLLHFIVLSKFSWMLISSYLQYIRFVKVLTSIPNKLILKSVIFGWGVPLVLVFIVALATTSQSYVSSSYELCYPRGLILHVAVLFPIGLIVMANLVVFCLIMYNVIYPKATTCGNKKMFKLRLYLALLLFFMLGFPWIFGLVAEMIAVSATKIVLFYIFCITGTFQGFVLFLFYVVANRETRKFWLRSVCKKKMNECYRT